jgi:hypothetical protein
MPHATSERSAEGFSRTEPRRSVMDEQSTDAGEVRSVLYRKEAGSHAIEVEVQGYAPHEAVTIVRALILGMVSAIYVPTTPGEGFDA